MTHPRRLLITCDDLGYHPTISEAIIDILARGVVRSASIMPAAPYFDEALARLRAIGREEVGVHLTLNSEYRALPIVPLSPRAQVASLVEADGRFPREVRTRPLAPAHVAIELRAQIERARRSGLRLTHLDGHMFCYDAALAGPQVLTVVEALARDYRLPLRRRDGAAGSPAVHMLWRGAEDVAERHAYYARFLETFAGPLTELIIHPGKDLAVMESFSRTAARRLADYTFFTGDAFERLIAQRRIRVVGWPER